MNFVAELAEPRLSPDAALPSWLFSALRSEGGIHAYAAEPRAKRDIADEPSRRTRRLIIEHLIATRISPFDNALIQFTFM